MRTLSKTLFLTFWFPLGLVFSSTQSEWCKHWGAIKANCLDSTDLLTYMYVHNEMQAEVMIKSQMTLIDDAVFFFFF